MRRFRHSALRKRRRLCGRVSVPKPPARGVIGWSRPSAPCMSTRGDRGNFDNLAPNHAVTPQVVTSLVREAHAEAVLLISVGELGGLEGGAVLAHQDPAPAFDIHEAYGRVGAVGIGLAHLATLASTAHE